MAFLLRSMIPVPICARCALAFARNTRRRTAKAISFAIHDNGFGDRNLICTCPPIEAYASVEDESDAPREAATAGA